MTSIPENPTPNTKKGKRAMHQSTLSLGDQNKSCYSTTHAESFLWRRLNGQQRVFLSHDPLHPSDRTGQLDPRDVNITPANSHSRHEHGPKDLIPHYILHSTGKQNKTRNCGGLEMKEITSPNEVTQYHTTYHTEHCNTSYRRLPDESSGQPVFWHNHNIITGEKTTPAGPRRPKIQSGETVLWATRRWEAQHDSFRLY